MEVLTALRMQRELRECLASHDVSGTVRFARENEPLFYCVLGKKQEGSSDSLIMTFTQMGYTVSQVHEILTVSPGDTMIRNAAASVVMKCDPQRCRLSQRLLSQKPEPLTVSGRQLVIEALRMAKIKSRIYRDRMDIRLFAQMEKRLRQRIAIALRQKDLSGLYETGHFLYEIEQII